MLQVRRDALVVGPICEGGRQFSKDGIIVFEGAQPPVRELV